MAIIITIVMSICIIVIIIMIIFIVTIINPTSYKCNECYLCSGARRADLHIHRGGARGHIMQWDWGGSYHPEEGHHLRKCVHPRQVSYEVNVHHYWYWCWSSQMTSINDHTCCYGHSVAATYNTSLLVNLCSGWSRLPAFQPLRWTSINLTAPPMHLEKNPDESVMSCLSLSSTVR